jgi:hypothetical protein
LEAARAIVGSGKTIKAPHIRSVFDEFPQYRPDRAKR